jgi:hypothetical protein
VLPATERACVSGLREEFVQGFLSRAARGLFSRAANEATEGRASGFDSRVSHEMSVDESAWALRKAKRWQSEDGDSDVQI